MAHASAPNLRLNVYWRGALLNTLVCTGNKKQTLRLPAGATLRIKRAGNKLHIGTLILAAGQTLQSDDLTFECIACERHDIVKDPVFVDAHLFQASVMSAVLHVCVIAFFYLSPSSDLHDSGGGRSSNIPQQMVNVTMSGASDHGAPRYSPKGEIQEEGERSIRPQTQRGEQSNKQSDRIKITFRQAAAPSVPDLNNGDEVGTIRKTLGEMNWAAPRSQRIKTAGVGGLPTTRVVVEPGVGSATLGLGKSKLHDTLQNREDESESVQEHRVDKRKSLEGLLDDASEDARIKSETLDPATQRYIARAVAERKNTIRACYENYGLNTAGEPTGRLSLSMLLHEDGHVSKVNASIDNPALDAVADCVQTQVSKWYLGNIIEGAPQPLRIPFLLSPKS